MRRAFFGQMAVAVAAVATALVAQAVEPSPVGLWKTIDDKTHSERSLVRITESDGVLTGRIERLLAPDAKQDAVCEKCTDDRKGRKYIGLDIIRGAIAADGVWEGGTVLDPSDGKVYRLRLKPQDGGKSLEVRGYIGPFYRNQTWIRVE